LYIYFIISRKSTPIKQASGAIATKNTAENERLSELKAKAYNGDAHLQT